MGSVNVSDGGVDYKDDGFERGLAGVLRDPVEVKKEARQLARKRPLRFSRRTAQVIELA
jgi:hypothetical protein